MKHKHVVMYRPQNTYWVEDINQLKPNERYSRGYAAQVTSALDFDKAISAKMISTDKDNTILGRDLIDWVQLTRTPLRFSDFKREKERDGIVVMCRPAYMRKNYRIPRQYKHLQGQQAAIDQALTEAKPETVPYYIHQHDIWKIKELNWDIETLKRKLRESTICNWLLIVMCIIEAIAYGSHVL